MVWTFDSSFFTTEDHRLEVVTEGPDRGCIQPADHGTPIQVAVDMQEQDVLSMLMETLTLK